MGGETLGGATIESPLGSGPVARADAWPCWSASCARTGSCCRAEGRKQGCEVGSTSDWIKRQLNEDGFVAVGWLAGRLHSCRGACSRFGDSGNGSSEQQRDFSTKKKVAAGRKTNGCVEQAAGPFGAGAKGERQTVPRMKKKEKKKRKGLPPCEALRSVEKQQQPKRKKREEEKKREER